MTSRVQATPRALEEIERLKARHGALVIHQSGGCCDGSSPICLPAAELPAGPGDVLLGEVAGTPVYIDADQDTRWGCPELLIDVSPGPAMGFSLEGVNGVHFVTAPAPARRTVVVGYDGSDEAERALSCALDHAGPRGRVIVVNATRRQPDALARPSVEPLLHDRLREGHALVDLVFLERSDVFDTDVDCEVIEDVPAAALLDAARRHDADEIVVGHRDRSRLRALSGSTAHTLIQANDRPAIVVVPSSNRATEGAS